MKNYTSSVPAARTIEKIEQKLVEAGAQGITKTYKDGLVTTISFSIMNPETQYPVYIRLPANVEGVMDVFLKSKSRAISRSQRENLQQQAQRTAWKLMQDWVEVQLSLIELKQAELLQVFMPYVWNGEQSLFQYMKANQMPALGFKELTHEHA